MTTNYNILCCDGGGIRGLLTAMLLDQLPQSILTNTTVFAGTSTGGIISIALAAGLQPSQLVTLYSSQCSAIFNTADSPAASYEQIKGYLTNLMGSDWSWVADGIALASEAGVLPKNLFAAKYNNTSLVSQLQSTLGEQASTLFSQLSQKLFVTTYQLDNGSGQWLPISIDNLSSSSNDSTLLDAALATSAAPTFFPPYNHPQLGYCIDGGTFANNPSMFVLSRVLQAGVSASSIRMLSLGTGATQNSVPSSYFGSIDPNLWGTYQYMFPLNAPSSVPSELLINLMMDGSSDIDDEQSGRILPPANYVRVEVPLTQAITLDDCSQVPALQTMADNFMQGDTWTSIVDWVTGNFV
ncbi:MAG TPA: patatin-like phospholipase family protein [Polyangia bacterium]|nr:patatin-like phospholipase family protein [Polyangia bacterium]